MDFLENPDVEDLAEHHAGQILDLQDREAKRIMRSYRRVRQDLRDRLEQLPAGSFSAQRARGMLVQIDAALEAMQTGILGDMDSAAESAALLGVDHLATEVKRWDRKFKGAVTPIDLDAVRAAAVDDTFLFNQGELYKSGMTAYSSGLRRRFQQGLLDATIAGDSMAQTIADLNAKIGKTFLGEEWKLERLVRTELHNVYSMGKLNGMSELADGPMPDLMKTLFHPMDKRTGDDSKRLNRNNPIVPVDDPFIEDSTGKTLTYMAPPNRPNDRAILIPYRKSWK